MLFCYEDVKKFQIKFNVPMPDTPELLDCEKYNFRLNFLKEEQNEFINSHVNNDYVGCIDALLDEVYVACGTALMMGFTSEDWVRAYAKMFDIEEELYKLPTIVAMASPKFLTNEKYNKAVSLLENNLQSFVNWHFHKDLDKCLESLCMIVAHCFSIANHMGLDYLIWVELWNDVQRANMTKERATSASQSKRKSSLDVIKPVGWVGPNGDLILEKRFPGYKNKLNKLSFEDWSNKFIHEPDGFEINRMKENRIDLREIVDSVKREEYDKYINGYWDSKINNGEK